MATPPTQSLLSFSLQGPGVSWPGLCKFHPQEAIGIQPSEYLEALGHSGSLEQQLELKALS